MPSWNIHLEAGERLANKLNFSGAKRKKFLLGCLLPDLNNGYINNVKVEKPHSETHFARDNKSSLNFYAEHKKEIEAKDPIYLGYLFHLYTDGFFNYEFYRTIKRMPIGEGLTREQKREIKHHDYWIYDKNFNHQIGIEGKKDLLMLAREASRISIVEISPEEILEVEEILKDDNLNQEFKFKKYKFYTKEKLDQILDNMIESFSKDYLGEDNA